MGSATEQLHFAAAKIAVAQVCLSTGYSAAEPAALRALADIAVRYLVAAGRAAASAANSSNRTETNLIDVAIAIEEISLPRGFPGAARPGAPPLSSRSGPLRGIMDFVSSIDEIPFARPMRRWKERENRSSRVTFAQASVKSPFPWIPRWLPTFPEDWDRHKCMKLGKGKDFGWNSEKELEILRKRRDFGWDSENKFESVPSIAVDVSFRAKRPLAEDRAKVKFVICPKVRAKIDLVEEERGRKMLKIAPPSSSPPRMSPVLMGTRFELVPC